jgi:hypothetical protein
MKRAQIRLQTLVIDELYNIGQIRIFWDDFGSKTWSWQYSPDGQVSGVWSWLPWAFPPVQTYDGSKIQKGADDKWCMVLTRTRYASADDAILNPMNLITGIYAILYAWGDDRSVVPRAEPPGQWFDNVYIDSANQTDPRTSGKTTGSGLGLFDLKKNSIMNPITHQKVDDWVLPPSGARIMYWNSEPWWQLTDPFSQLEQQYFFLKRTKWIEEKNRGSLDKLPPGYNPGMPNFGPSRPPSGRKK